MDWSSLRIGETAHNAVICLEDSPENLDIARTLLDDWQSECEQELQPGLKLTHLDVIEGRRRITRTVMVVKA